MTQYISKDALVAEIEKRRDKNFNSGGSPSSEYCYEDDEILSIIDTLEVKEVDLDKEIDEWCNKCISDYELEGWVGIAIQNVAKHFFELGLKAKQG